jgi:hypothetical protein
LNGSGNDPQANVDLRAMDASGNGSTAIAPVRQQSPRRANSNGGIRAETGASLKPRAASCVPEPYLGGRAIYWATASSQIPTASQSTVRIRTPGGYTPRYTTTAVVPRGIYRRPGNANPSGGRALYRRNSDNEKIYIVRVFTNVK